MRRLAVVIVAAMVAVGAAGKTVHRSFRGGYPAAVSEARQNSAEQRASVGVNASPNAKPVAYKSIVGTVTRVSDGDAIWVTDSAGKHKIRLDKIDAPESDQVFGKEAAQYLKDLVYGEEVEVRWAAKDKYGRILGIVYLKRENGMVEVNLTMVKNGCAWHYSYHDKTPAYAEAEKDARKNRRGLWTSDSPVNPYRWRKSKRIM